MNSKRLLVDYNRLGDFTTTIEYIKPPTELYDDDVKFTFKCYVMMLVLTFFLHTSTR